MTEPNIAFVANLLADPSRAAMCLSLAGGEARPAGELAARAGISAQAASNHLAKLIAGRLLRVERQGRWRYYRLAGVDVGHAVEALSVVAPRGGAAARGQRHGRLGAAPQERAHLLQPPGRPAGRRPGRRADRASAGSRTTATGTGSRRPGPARSAGSASRCARAAREAPARRCIDWTERRPHVAGPVGTALAKVALDRGWVRRLRGTRAVAVTPLGRTQLAKVFNLRWEERP